MKRCFSFLKKYLNTDRAKNRLKGPIALAYEDLHTEDVNDSSAIYFFVSREHHYVLPWGNSPVIYIGKADKLRTRLMQHLNDLEKKDPKSQWVYSRYNYMKMSGGFDLYYLRTQGAETAKCLESKALEGFYDKYGSLPIGNGAFSYR